jgi:hypothetical protein
MAGRPPSRRDVDVEPQVLVHHRGGDRGPADVTSWKTMALCRGKPTSLWFPDRGDARASQTARLICRRCPVAAACLAAAMAVEDDLRFGIRGGLTAEQRYQLAGAA